MMFPELFFLPPFGHFVVSANLPDSAHVGTALVSRVFAPRTLGGTVQTRGSASSNLVPPINHCGDVSGTLGDKRRHGGTSTAATLQKKRTSSGVFVSSEALGQPLCLSFAT
uniref:Putative secreted protein n=1 Tax=Ixodes ricinus TaxID=34613 RepID=A0A6B0UJH0_IXORI